eukprot:7380299-Prymnesium_polylepis.1
MARSRESGAELTCEAAAAIAWSLSPREARRDRGGGSAGAGGRGGAAPVAACCRLPISDGCSRACALATRALAKLGRLGGGGGIIAAADSGDGLPASPNERAGR